MPFCQNCGAEYQTEAKYCNQCGNKLDNVVANSSSNQNNFQDEITLWEGKPEGLSDMLKDKANLNNTYYILTNQRIMVTIGLINKKREEIELLKIKDFRVIQGLKEKMLNIGSVEIISTDETAPVLVLRDIKSPHEVKEILRSAVKKEKMASGVMYQERI